MDRRVGVIRPGPRLRRKRAAKRLEKDVVKLRLHRARRPRDSGG